MTLYDVTTNIRVIVRDKRGDIVSLALVTPSAGRRVVSVEPANASIEAVVDHDPDRLRRLVGPLATDHRRRHEVGAILEPCTLEDEGWCRHCSKV